MSSKTGVVLRERLEEGSGPLGYYKVEASIFWRCREGTGHCSCFFDSSLFSDAENAIQQCVVFLQSREQRAGYEPAETTKNSTVWVSVDSDIETDRVEA
jgi:hypothetical protein